MALVAYDFSDGSDAESYDDKPTENLDKDLSSAVTANSRTSASHLIDDEEVDIILKAPINNSIPPDGILFYYCIIILTYFSYEIFIMVFIFIESESSDEDDEPVKITFSSLPKPSFHAFSTYDPKIKNLKLTSLAKVIPLKSQVN